MPADSEDIFADIFQRAVSAARFFVFYDWPMQSVRFLIFKECCGKACNSSFSKKSIAAKHAIVHFQKRVLR